MKVADVLEFLAANIILLFLLYFVTADQAERTAYAAREGLGFLFSRSFLVQVSTLQGSRGTLQSPFSLDWIQILVAALIIVDVLFAYELVERRHKVRPQVS